MIYFTSATKTKEDIEQLLYENKNLVYYMLTKTGQLLNQDAESAAWEGLWDAVNLFDIYAKTAPHFRMS